MPYATLGRYVVAVTADLRKVSYMMDKLLPLVRPRDSMVLIHIVDEVVEDEVAGEEADVEQVLHYIYLPHVSMYSGSNAAQTLRYHRQENDPHHHMSSSVLR